MKITADGLGAVRIGMAWKDAVEAGALDVVRDEPTCGAAVDPATKASVVAKDGVVVLIMVQDAGTTTSEGIGVGDAASDLFDAYGNVALGEHGRAILRSGENELVIGLFGGIVTYVWARRTGVTVGC